MNYHQYLRSQLNPPVSIGINYFRTGCYTHVVLLHSASWPEATDKASRDGIIYINLDDLDGMDQEEEPPLLCRENELLKEPGTPGFIGSLDDTTKQLSGLKV